MTLNQRGFSLVELMVAMAIAGFAMAGIYGVYNAQIKIHVTQSVVVDNQQNLRNAMFIIQNSIRMAGYDPSRGVRLTDAPLSADNKQLGLLTLTGLQNLCASIAAVVPSIGQLPLSGTGPDSIAFSLDWNGDQNPPAAGTGVIQNLNTEVVAFRLGTGNTVANNANVLYRYGPETGWRELADNIDALSFRYFDQAGLEVLPSPPATTLTRTLLDNVRSVQVTLTSIPPREVSGAAGNKAAASLSALVKMRNSGLP
jgi:prepilin-type N-terminal cleavage/methylation domain-containing protein